MRYDDIQLSSFSGWVDPPDDLRPALTGDVVCDVAVIGGGINGMSTAIRLTERGKDVVLLEARFCGHGASSRNAGQLAGAPGGDLQLINLLAGKKMPGMMRLAEHAAHHVEDFIAKRDIDCEYEATGNAFAAVSRGQMGRVRRVAKIVSRAGGHVAVGTSEELGIPRGFVGGMREVIGGRMNPGKFSLGMRDVLFDSAATVYESTEVTDVAPGVDGGVIVTTPEGRVHAEKVVLATNAYAGQWDITPRHLSVPIYVVEVETEPIEPARLEAMGWTSRMGLVTQHAIMENYRLTPRNTIVFGVRRIERGMTYPLPDRTPSASVVKELAEAFETRFPDLADVAIERAWGGWIAITPSWLPVAGQVGSNVYYSIACNGHGLAQAPYVGTLMADAIVDGARHADLETIWATKPKFPRPMMMGPAGLRTIWAYDRMCDAFNGSRRNARRAATGKSLSSSTEH